MPSEQRAALVQTPVGAELLTFTHLVGRDEISRCLAYTVGFVSTNADIDPLKMLGGVVSIEGESDPKRWFSGLIAEFRLTRDRNVHACCIREIGKPILSVCAAGNW